MPAKKHTSKLGESRIDQEQFALLHECAEAGSAAAWNEWRERNPDEEIWLQGARLDSVLPRPALRGINLRGANLARSGLRGAVLVGADLRDTVLTGASLQGAILVDADLRGAYLQEADIRGTNLRNADLRAAHCAFAKVDGETLLFTHRIGPATDFTGVSLDSARVEPGLKQLLEYNVRRRRWEEWYGHHPLLGPPTRLFWIMCDYGHSTWRIVLSFAVLAIVYALGYKALPETVVAVWASSPAEPMSLSYALYFSVVTMTTLGFGDVYASPHSLLGQFLLSSQVILGYVLLGALVTRLSVLFTAGGPSAWYYEGERRLKKPRPPSSS